MSMTEMPRPTADDDLQQRHQAAEANPLTFGYAKPDGVHAAKVDDDVEQGRDGSDQEAP